MILLFAPTDQQAMPSPLMHSESSASDQSSDEEYMCPLTKKKPKAKKTVQRAKEEKKEALRSEEQEVMGRETGYKPVSVASFPPQLVRTTPQSAVLQGMMSDYSRKQVSKLVRPEAPPLVKTAASSSGSHYRHYSTSSEIKVVRGNAVGVVMGGARSKQSEQLSKVKPNLDHMSPIISIPKIQQPPQVILSAGIQRAPPPLVSTKSRDQSRDSRSHAHPVISTPSSSSSQHHKHHSHAQKPTKRVSIDSLLGPSTKSSPHRPPKTVPYFSSPVKKSKVPPTATTQYGVITASPSSHSHTSSPHKIQTPTSAYPTVQPPTNIPHVMTPYQLVSPTQNQAPHALAGTSQAAYQAAVGSGGLIFLQGAAPQTTTYISHGGQTYQVINPGVASGESAQKVSVIMQPPAGTSYLTSADLQGGIQYIHQLDGPPDQEKPTGGGGKGEKTRKTRKEFEKMRRQEQEKLGLDKGDKNSKSLTPATREPQRDKFGTPQCQEVAETPGGQGENTQKQSAEDRMSEKLKFYLTKEKERVKGVPSKCPPGTKTSEKSSANRGGPPQTSISETPPPGDCIPQASPRQRGRQASSSSSSDSSSFSSSRCRKKFPSISHLRGSKPSHLVVSPTLFCSSSSPPDPSGQILPEPLTPTKTTATKDGSKPIKKTISGAAKTKVKMVPKPLFAPDNLTSDSPVSPSASSTLIGQSAPPTSCSIETESISVEHDQDSDKIQCLNSNSNNNGKSSDQEPESHSETRNGGGMESGQFTRNDGGMESGQCKGGTEQNSLLGKHSTEEEVTITPPRKRGRPPGRGRGRGRGKIPSVSPVVVEDERPIRSHLVEQPSEDNSAQPKESEPIVPRKRGRPKKSTNQTTESEPPKDETESEPIVPRKRGRPKKSTNQTTESEQPKDETESEPIVPRKRGRPKKSTNQTTESEQPKDETESEPIVPRKRGRPKKSTNQTTESEQPKDETESEPVTPRKRGRPKKSTNQTTETEQPKDETESEPVTPRKRGRPKKLTNQATGSGQESIVESKTSNQDTPETPSISTRRKRLRETEPVQDNTTSSQQSETETETTTPKRHRGRPRTSLSSGKPHIFVCKTCSKTFPTKYLLQVHVDNEHPPDLGVRNHYIIMTPT